MSLTYSHGTSQGPMYKGLKAREGYSFSLTSPSHFWALVTHIIILLQNLSENEMLNRRILAELFANSKIFLYLCRAFQKNAKLDNRNHG